MPPLADLHLPTLMGVSTVVMLVVAGIMTLFGCTQHIYRGFWWWTAAQWMGSVGVGLQLARDAWPAVLPLSIALLLQWPVTLLVGMRRFHARSALPGSVLTDLLLLAAVTAGWLVAWAGPGTLLPRVTAFSFGMALVFCHAAWVLGRLPARSRRPTLQALRLLLLANASVQAAHLALVWSGAIAPQPATPGMVLPMVLTTLCLLYLALVLTYERTGDNLRESQRQLRVLADMDMLTEVPNRRHFEELASRALAMSAPGSASLMLFDIDHFKQVNDSHGHAAGDDALRLVARCARQLLRTGDVVGRLGGDEFVVLLPETDVNAALHVADRMVAQIEDECLHQPYPVLSLSFGAVQALPGESLSQALRRADEALYEAKRQGRSRAVIAGSQEDGEAVFGASRPLGLTTS
jgi:diguanylate cyclase (GGDEF)-like protein